jgi:hypothetical protein
MKNYNGHGSEATHFLNLRIRWSQVDRCTFWLVYYHRETASGIHQIRDCVSPGVGLDISKKLRNKYGNVHTRHNSFSAFPYFDLWEWCQWCQELYGVNYLCMGGVFGTCLARYWHHYGRSTYMVAQTAGDSHMRIPHSVTMHKNSCQSSHNMSDIVIWF